MHPRLRTIKIRQRPEASVRFPTVRLSLPSLLKLCTVPDHRPLRGFVKPELIRSTLFMSINDRKPKAPKLTPQRRYPGAPAAHPRPELLRENTGDGRGTNPEHT